MKIRIDFAAPAGASSDFQSSSIFESSSDVLSGAALSALFQRFPDTLQNIASIAPPGEVHLRTRSAMPADWADGSAKIP